MNGSRLFYFNSTLEVRLGDRVQWSRFLRAPLRGVVCYIPGISAPHPDLEYEGVKEWAIRADNGMVYSMVYDPDNSQPGKHVKFVARGDDRGLLPDEPLE